MIPPPPYLVKDFPSGRRGVLLPLSDRRAAAHGVSMYTVTRPTAFTVQRLAHAWTRALGARALPGRARAWSPAWPTDAWAELCRQWTEALGEVDHFAVYQRRQAERDGLTLVLVRQARATAVVKVRTTGETLAWEQDALECVSTYRPETFGVPRPLGLGRVGDDLHWSAQEAVFQHPHAPELDPPRALFDEISDSLRALLPSSDPELVPAHNDLTPWNMRRDSAGRIWVYDWEDCGLAPADADRAYYTASVRAVVNRRMPTDLPDRAVVHVRDHVGRRVTTNEPDERLKQDQIAALTSRLGGPTVLMVTPSFDLYGSDLQLLMSVEALRAVGWRVVVLSPTGGPLQGRLEAAGAETSIVDFPVLRRTGATPASLVRTGVDAASGTRRMRRIIRDLDADVVYVNTLTLPWWISAAKAAGVPSLCHVHEAELGLSPHVRRLLTAPLLMSDSVVANSCVTGSTAIDAVPGIRRSVRLVYNGVAPPPEAAPRAIRKDPTRLAVVGRLSERKGVHTALEAAAVLRGRGRDVVLEVCGTAFGDHSSYAERLEDRAAQPDLQGSVVFSGYVSPVWPVLERADVVLAPSTGESFGNAVVESQLAFRPVVASAVHGHDETIVDGTTGLLVPSGDPVAFADAVERLLDDRGLAADLVASARDRAVSEFSRERYAQGIVSAVTDVLRW